ncbi:GL23769 [Drosophila persimilis]|uniref:GL23769 n=2 Tax=Drosophila persimilis TaxID=7234 RepID=B4G5W9_DROPE|nr:GL23769 [Drosophila persimilis]
MNATGLFLLMGLALCLELFLLGPTSCAPLSEELEAPSPIKEIGGLAAFAYSRKKLPKKQGQKNLIMPRSKNMTRRQRMEYADNCEPLGMVCKFAEQCCTRVCMVATKRCSYVGNS